ncbi:alpha/beta hydrolase [Cupriavidus numazuensis]|uniref:N-octanoylanthranilate hydrolase AqdA1 n=1 Tax=Cupriavidus numazuensis TaxID=221992 RepID=A0ABM8TGY1_9BURK|nr:alpha/beta hydrolase [Cupriavidus numazuensis]CAG2145758.1 putative N-octanoylanthranilate hydrolase AqdA1 [Cupriavidus numazuensis]
MTSVRTGTTAVPPQPPLPFEAAVAYEKTVLAWADELPDHVAASRDVPYGPSVQHRYDVFTTDTLHNAPVLVFWHGGGWTNGYKEYVSFMAPWVTALGMVLVAPAYRLAPEHRLPAAFDDAVLLLASLQNDIAKWGGDPARLYLAGHSAGGGIAAMTAMRQGALVAAGVAPDSVRGCLPISGIMNLYHPSPAPGSLEERVYTTLLDRPESDAVMSPLTWSAGTTVPMVLSYGQHDSERVIRSNRSLYAMLAARQAAASCHEHAGEDHFGTHTALADPNHPWYARLAQLVMETSR